MHRCGFMLAKENSIGAPKHSPATHITRFPRFTWLRYDLRDMHAQQSRLPGLISIAGINRILQPWKYLIPVDQHDE